MNCTSITGTNFAPMYQTKGPYCYVHRKSLHEQIFFSLTCQTANDWPVSWPAPGRVELAWPAHSSPAARWCGWYHMASVTRLHSPASPPPHPRPARRSCLPGGSRLEHTGMFKCGGVFGQTYWKKFQIEKYIQALYRNLPNNTIVSKVLKSFYFSFNFILEWSFFNWVLQLITTDTKKSWNW